MSTRDGDDVREAIYMVSDTAIDSGCLEGCFSMIVLLLLPLACTAAVAVRCLLY